MADALAAHQRALSYGGRDGIPNPGLVQSALARPYNGYYRQIHAKAAAFVQSMSSNHGFADGNKRTTLLLLETLLERSGYRLVPGAPQESLELATEQMILDVVTHQLSFDELVAWLKLRIARQ